jgi:tetratricopeptide (TPR) repeat protein
MLTLSRKIKGSPKGFALYLQALAGLDDYEAIEQQVAAKINQLQNNRADNQATINYWQNYLKNFKKNIQYLQQINQVNSPKKAFKLAQAFGGLNNIDQARSYFNQVINDYPNSALVETSKKKLAAIKRFYTDYFYIKRLIIILFVVICSCLLIILTILFIKNGLTYFERFI